MSEDVELPPETKDSLRKHWDEMHGRRWIPVSERLPEPYQPVLAWNASPPVPYVCWWCPVDKWNNRSGHGGPDPTHWMPLPEPPEVQ